MTPNTKRRRGRIVPPGTGKNLAAALYDPRNPTLTRSSKLHRPRGYTCGLGICPNCMMRVNGVPNVRVCQDASNEESCVERQNQIPVLDSLGVLTRLHGFIPAGFQYRRMYSSKTKRRIFYSILKRASGLGRMPEDPSSATASREELSPDLLVVGGGIAGLAAAKAASAHESVLLVESQRMLGGEAAAQWGMSTLEEARGETKEVGRMETAVTDSRNIQVLLNTTVVGYYRLENLFLAVSDGVFYEIKPKRIVIATGCHQTLPLFPGNDSPRVIQGTGFQMLMNAGAKTPRTSFVIDINGKGALLAADMVARGIEVLGVSRPGVFTEAEAALCKSNGLRMLPQTLVRKARPDGQLRLEGSPQFASVKAEAVVVCGRYQPNYELAAQMGCNLRFLTGEPAPVMLEFPRPKFPLDFSLAGSVAGRVSSKECAEDGALRGSGHSNISEAVMDIAPDEYLKRACLDREFESFVCACEDVSTKELLTAIESGYAKVEDLKRFTGALTGPCQGKQCALNVAAILHMKQPGGAYLTTLRQPLKPVSFTDLAARK